MTPVSFWRFFFLLAILHEWPKVHQVLDLHNLCLNWTIVPALFWGLLWLKCYLFHFYLAQYKAEFFGPNIKSFTVRCTTLIWLYTHILVTILLKSLHLFSWFFTLFFVLHCSCFMLFLVSHHYSFMLFPIHHSCLKRFLFHTVLISHHSCFTPFLFRGVSCSSFLFNTVHVSCCFLFHTVLV